MSNTLIVFDRDLKHLNLSACDIFEKKEYIFPEMNILIFDEKCEVNHDKMFLYLLI